jgi:hypothetical protein
LRIASRDKASDVANTNGYAVDPAVERLARLAGPDSEGDWSAVLARTRRPGIDARRQHSRRPLVLALAAAIFAAVVVPTSIALRRTVVDFLTGDPAPKRIVGDFSAFDKGWPQGMRGPGVIANPSRKAARRRGARRRAQRALGRANEEG